MNSPSKRAYTEEKRESHLAYNMQNNTLPDDLAARLQNVGSRVRKSVMEGYPSVTPTPFPSPDKGVHTTGHIFVSAHAILNDVYNSPSGSYSTSRSKVDTPTCSPKKRARDEADGAELRLRLRTSSGPAGYDIPTDIESDDDDDIEVITYSDESDKGTETRPIRPLRKSRGRVSENMPIGAGSFNTASGEGIFDVPYAKNPNEREDDDMDIFM